jgi:hypothetical protein
LSRRIIATQDKDKPHDRSPSLPPFTEDRTMSGLDTTDAVSFAFGLFNLLRLASYFPQIVAVARDHHGAHAISLDDLDRRECHHGTLCMGASCRRRARVDQCIQYGVLPAGLLRCNLQARRLLSFSDGPELRDRLTRLQHPVRCSTQV